MMRNENFHRINKCKSTIIIIKIFKSKVLKRSNIRAILCQWMTKKRFSNLMKEKPDSKLCIRNKANERKAYSNLELKLRPKTVNSKLMTKSENPLILKRMPSVTGAALPNHSIHKKSKKDTQSGKMTSFIKNSNLPVQIVAALRIILLLYRLPKEDRVK